MSAEMQIVPRNYRDAWRRYRRFRRLGLFWGLGWIPVTAAYALLFWKYGSFPLEYLGLYVVLGMIHGVSNAFWTCPRCKQLFSNPGRFFVRGGGYDKGVAAACVHCG
jgi:hypothetical protein